MYYVTKTYDHSEGLSVCFRQWRAESHCNLLHGYALAFELTFAAEELNDANWVLDFGGLKEVREFLHSRFDHTLIVAKDDPKLDEIVKIEDLGLADVILVERVGAESFAKMVFTYLQVWLRAKGYSPRVNIARVKVSEHGGNSAAYGESIA